jgi:hypothetical protein
MGKFIITEEERNHIKGLYEQPTGDNSEVKEESEDTLSSGKKFKDIEGVSLKKKQFKINSNYNVATLKHPKTGKVYTVTPSTKYDSGLKITYDGGSYEGPHDACDVKIDKIIGYKSLEGGYNHK